MMTISKAAKIAIEKTAAACAVFCISTLASVDSSCRLIATGPLGSMSLSRNLFPPAVLAELTPFLSI